MSYHEPMADANTDTSVEETRRERAERFIDQYIDEHRELFEKLARE
jgi:hypothetical protein